MGLVGCVQCFRGFLTGINRLGRVHGVDSLEVLKGVVDRLEELMEVVRGQRKSSSLVDWLQRVVNFSETQRVAHLLRRLVFLCFQVNILRS